MATIDDQVQAIFDKLPAESNIAGAGVDAPTLDEVVEAVGAMLDTKLAALAASLSGLTAFPRDLSPPDFIWPLTTRADGQAYSPLPLRLVPGESLVAGFDCKTGGVLPPGATVREYTNPVGLSGDLSATRVGTGGQYANCQVTAAADATVGEAQWVSMEMTNSFGSGPRRLVAKVEVIAPHP